MTGLSAIFSTMNRDFVLNVTTEADEMTSLRRLVARGTLDGFILTDNGSTNGTSVNGSRITSHRLVDGDRIELGATVIHFRAG